MMKKDSKQVNKNLTKLIRIDAGYHKLLKMRATNECRSIKELVEDIFVEALSLETSDHES